MSHTSYARLFVDGPNMDMVLGSNILGRRPWPEERPRWNRVADFARGKLQVAKPTFVLNGNQFANGSTGLLAFRLALRDHMGYDVSCPCGDGTDPVDQYILQQLKTIARSEEPCSVAVMTHDHGYAPDLRKIMALGATVWVIGFPEEMSPQLLALRSRGAIILDLEHDLSAFDIPLPRPYLNSCAASWPRPMYETTSRLGGAA